jgi:hypothetical protein
MAKKSVEDLRAYWQEIATKNGLDADTISAMDAALGNDSVAKAFRQAFVPVPEHHSRLDELKTEYNSRKAELDDWYANTAMPAYQTNLNGIEKLHQYESVYGPIDPSSVTRQDAATLGFNSKAELESYLDDRFRAERAGYIGISKALPKMSVDYYNRFKEVLDPDEVEKISVQKGLPPDLAYKEYISPRVEAQAREDHEKAIKEAREAGAREALSKANLPIDSIPKESSPFYERHVEAESKNLSDADQDRLSRSEFMNGWNSYAEQIVNKNRP